MSFNLSYDQGRMRNYHYFMLLGLIQKRKQVSRAKLANLTKMSNTSVGKIIKTLIADGLVIEVGQTEGHVGRRATLLEVNPAGAYIIGIDIQLHIVRMATVSLNGDIIDKRELSFQKQQCPQNVLDRIATDVSKMINHLTKKVSDKILAIGVSIPGLVTWPDGEVLTVPQLHWEHVNIKSFLENRLNQTVHVDNDVRAALLAESLFGSMTSYQEAACIYVGSGLGGAMMTANEILRGHTNTLGEIGHMTLNPDGPLCDCGRLGCLQTYICASELQKQTGQSTEEIFAAFDNQEDWACKIIHRAQKYLSIAVANIVCIYNPEAILLTGPMIEDFPVLTAGITTQSKQYVWEPLKDSYQIKQSSIGKDNGVIGASALVLHEFLRHSNESL